ncbi:MAG: response regulator [Candidatus Omnitrophota bacterium]
MKNNILIVDDEPNIITILQEFLQAKGYGTQSASSAEEAFDALKAEPADTVLLDMRLPGMQGKDAARLIKEKYPQTKIIVITGYAQDAEDLLRERLLEAVFAKPIRLNELYEKLRSSLEGGRAERLRARVLLIKAKLLLVEPSEEISKALRAYLCGLGIERGQDYEVYDAKSNDEAIERIKILNPDILLVNNAAGIIPDTRNKEIIIYDEADLKSSFPKELERITRILEMLCLKKGFIDIQVVEL